MVNSNIFIKRVKEKPLSVILVIVGVLVFFLPVETANVSSSPVYTITNKAVRDGTYRGYNIYNDTETYGYPIYMCEPITSDKPNVVGFWKTRIAVKNNIDKVLGQQDSELNTTTPPESVTPTNSGISIIPAGTPRIYVRGTGLMLIIAGIILFMERSDLEYLPKIEITFSDS
jgi:hypothetical protein